MGWARVLSAGLVLAASSASLADPSTSPWSALGLSAPLRGLLSTGAWDATPNDFRIVPLSFLADGCVARARRDPAERDAALACVSRCVELASASRRQPPRPESDDGLWLTHDALIFGAGDALGACPDPTRHKELAVSLARRSLADAHRHVASYTDVKSRWPADQTATLASLAR